MAASSETCSIQLSGHLVSSSAVVEFGGYLMSSVKLSPWIVGIEQQVKGDFERCVTVQEITVIKASYGFPCPDPGLGLPEVCKGCRHLHGQKYGGVLTVCAIHPSGNGVHCEDADYSDLLRDGNLPLAQLEQV